MDRAGQTAAFALAFLLTAWATSATATQPDTGSESAVLRLKAFELAYNLDYNEAVAALNRAIALDPSNPANQRALAGVTWLQMLFSRGAVIIDFYTGGSFKPRVKIEEPPPDLAEQFETHAAKALELSERLVKARRQEPSALYELGATVGLIASYRASVQGEVLDALRAARRAYDMHTRGLELLWLEEGATASSPSIRETGFAGGEPALWYLKLGTTRVLLGNSEQARRDLDAALASEGHAWVQGRARLELGKLADLAGDRARARTEYEDAISLCEAGNDRRCQSEAKRLRQTAYAG